MQQTSPVANDITLDTRWTEEIERVLPVMDKGMKPSKGGVGKLGGCNWMLVVLRNDAGQKRTLEIVAAVRQLTGQQVSFFYSFYLFYISILI